MNQLLSSYENQIEDLNNGFVYEENTSSFSLQGIEEEKGDPHVIPIPLEFFKLEKIQLL